MARPGPIPDIRLGGLLQERAASIEIRSSTSETSSSSSTTASCGPKDTTGACERYYNSTNSTTIPIVLGIVLPLTVALVVFVILHRRHVKKLRKEDAEDKHKSLDFGLGESGAGLLEKKKRKADKAIPEMSSAEAKNAIRRDRGLSMDMQMQDPFLLPPEVQHSRESLHSLSRSLNPGDDKYRTTTFVPDDGSLRSPSSLRSPIDDSSSTFTDSSRKRLQTGSRLGDENFTSNVPTIRKPAPAAIRNNDLLAPASVDPVRDSFVSTASSTGGVAALRKSNNYLGAFISGGGARKTESKETSKAPETTVTEILVETPTSIQTPVSAPSNETTNNNEAVIVMPLQHDVRPSEHAQLSPAVNREPRLPQLSFIESYATPTDSGYASSEHTDFHKAAESPVIEQPSIYNQITLPDTQGLSQDHGDNDSDYYDESTYSIGDYEEELGYDPHHLTMGSRPLPPDDPSENPEQRANRIRSFYKEYFDESKPSPQQNIQYFDGSEDYAQNYPPQGYRQPPPRQQRGPPRGPMPAPGRHRATVSNGSHLSGSRAYSTQSGRHGSAAARQPPKKKLPLPKPLVALPTPHMLKDDTMLPIDFAPPGLARTQRSGTPDNLRGGARPYSPGVRAHMPLVSSFDDLAVMPSP